MPEVRLARDDGFTLVELVVSAALMANKGQFSTVKGPANWRSSIIFGKLLQSADGWNCCGAGAAGGCWAGAVPGHATAIEAASKAQRLAGNRPRASIRVDDNIRHFQPNQNSPARPTRAPWLLPPP